MPIVSAVSGYQETGQSCSSGKHRSDVSNAGLAFFTDGSALSFSPTYLSRTAPLPLAVIASNCTANSRALSVRWHLSLATGGTPSNFQLPS